MEMEITIPALPAGIVFTALHLRFQLLTWPSSRLFVSKSKCEDWTSPPVTATVAFGQGTESFGSRELQQLTERRDGRRSAVPDSVSEPGTGAHRGRSATNPEESICVMAAMSAMFSRSTSNRRAQSGSR
jgi:hypothetical protein